MDELWDIERLSRYLGMKKSSLYALVERREIPHYRIGRLARFRPAEIDEWLLTKRCEGDSEKGTRRVSRRRLSPPSAASQIVRAAIDDLKPRGYNSSGKSDRIKGLGKEG
jgi:excisionase family DNA binding protein